MIQVSRGFKEFQRVSGFMYFVPEIPLLRRDLIKVEMLLFKDMQSLYICVAVSLSIKPTSEALII